MKKLLAIILLVIAALAATAAVAGGMDPDAYMAGGAISAQPQPMDESRALSPRAYGLDASDYLWSRWMASQNSSEEDRQWLRSNLDQFLAKWGYLDGMAGRHVRLNLGSRHMSLAVGMAHRQEQTLGDAPYERDGLPPMDFALELQAGGLRTAPGIGYGSYDFNRGASGRFDGFKSWVAFLPVEYSQGGFTARAGAYMGENIDAAYNGRTYFSLHGPSGVPLQTADGKLADTRSYGGFLALEYSLGSWTFTGGAGAVYTANEAWTAGLNYRLDSYIRRAYFFAAPYRVNGRLVVQPEFSYFDHGQNPADGKETADDWLLGVNMQFSF